MQAPHKMFSHDPWLLGSAAMVGYDYSSRVSLLVDCCCTTNLLAVPLDAGWMCYQQPTLHAFLRPTRRLLLHSFQSDVVCGMWMHCFWLLEHRPMQLQLSTIFTGASYWYNDWHLRHCDFPW
jgi:hypothetical protein